MTAADRERELRHKIDELRFAAPNPRDFRTWDDFYAAQGDHERQMAAIESEIEAVIAEAWS